MMLVFGGMFEVTKELDDMHLFDFRNKRWITFFEEAQSPVRMKSTYSPETSPTSNKKSMGWGIQQESFKIDPSIARPITVAGNQYNLSSPSRSIASKGKRVSRKASIFGGSVINQSNSKSQIRNGTTSSPQSQGKAQRA